MLKDLSLCDTLRLFRSEELLRITSGLLHDMPVTSGDVFV